MKTLKYVADIPGPWLAAFRDHILNWYRENGRDLPWRKTRDPYAIIVSEIMLQQTQVRTVMPVYQAFLSRFPTVDALAQATRDEVKAITDPLGYKARGGRLHEIAHVVVANGGRFPDTLEGLLSLPGVGRYTAGAVLSFAFGQDAPIVDTNVNRLLGRFFGVDFRRRDAETGHRLWSLAQAVIPPRQAPEFNQALMDMGAMVCTARHPLCLYCPLAGDCASAMGGDAYPKRAAETAVTYYPGAGR